MGCDKFSNSMASRPGSVSSGLRSNSGMRGQTLKSSSFCPHSSSKMTQSLLRDHMVSHYKKIYSAKAAVDNSVPKSLIHSVKYNDQMRQKQLKKDGRPQSAQRNSRASCFTPQSRLSVQSEERPYLSSRNSTISNLTFGTSFRVNDIAYTPRNAGLRNSFHPGLPGSDIRSQRPGSDIRYQRPGAYKSSQHPEQKTYSGDLLKKNSQHFTQEKPFTPKTLKSDKSSYLSKYRYYRAPLTKQAQGHTQSKVMEQDKDHGSKKRTDELSQSPEQEWSEDEFSSSYLQETSPQSHANKSRDHHLFHSPSRVFPENRKAATLEQTFAEEEELLYLKLISAVTEDILSRGHFSDRILNLVIQRHIEMNRHHLDEDKMRHLMELLRKEFQDQTRVSTCSADPEKTENRLFEAFHSHLELKGNEAKQKDHLLSYTSFINSSDLPDYTGRSFKSMLACSPELTPSSSVIIEDNRDFLYSQLGSNAPSNTEISEVDSHQSEMGTNATDNTTCENPEYGDKEFNLNRSAGCCDEPSDELKGLEGQFSELLHVSSSTHNVAVSEQHAEGSSSDSEF